MSGGFATLVFERRVSAAAPVLWQAWTAPAARAVWAAPASEVTVEFVEAQTRVGGVEVSLCKVAGQPDVRCEVGWLDLSPGVRTVSHEVISIAGIRQSAALITAEIAPEDGGSRIVATVQLSNLASDMEAGYRAGFGAGLDNLVGVTERTMVIDRLIRAPRDLVWSVWLDPDRLPQWWGPDGFSCRTDRIDLRPGGEWVFDMIGPDGTVYPNHHLYREILPTERLAYTLLWGENGPKHADAWVAFEEEAGATRVTLGMVFSTVAEYRNAKGFGAEEFGLQTLGKLARAAGAS